MWATLTLIWWVYVTIMCIPMLWSANLEQFLIIIMGWLMMMVLPYIFNQEVR